MEKSDILQIKPDHDPFDKVVRRFFPIGVTFGDSVTTLSVSLGDEILNAVLYTSLTSDQSYFELSSEIQAYVVFKPLGRKDFDFLNQALQKNNRLKIIFLDHEYYSAYLEVSNFSQKTILNNIFIFTSLRFKNKKKLELLPCGIVYFNNKGQLHKNSSDPQKKIAMTLKSIGLSLLMLILSPLQTIKNIFSTYNGAYIFGHTKAFFAKWNFKYILGLIWIFFSEKVYGNTFSFFAKYTPRYIFGNLWSFFAKYNLRYIGGMLWSVLCRVSGAIWVFLCKYNLRYIGGMLWSVLCRVSGAIWVFAVQVYFKSRHIVIMTMVFVKTLIKVASIRAYYGIKHFVNFLKIFLLVQIPGLARYLFVHIYWIFVKAFRASKHFLYLLLFVRGPGAIKRIFINFYWFSFRLIIGFYQFNKKITFYPFRKFYWFSSYQYKKRILKRNMNQ